jgi:hypothetical protein
MRPLAIAEQAATVTPDNSNDLPAGACEWLYVGVSGDISADVGGTPVLFKAVPVGPLWVRISRVRATATTATTMLAMY